MPTDSNTLERLVPEELSEEDATGRATYELHLERYAFAARKARPGRLLDLACGVGYGTRHLADHAAGLSEAVGVDVSEDAVAHARARYAGPGVEYRVGDAMTFADPQGFDTIVSLETVEHLPDPEGFLAHLVTLLAPEGVLIASVPTTPSVDVNPHHLHDFTAASFRRLGARHGLTELDAFAQVQPVGVLAVLRGTEKRMQDARPNLLGWYARHPGALLKRIGATLRHGFANHYLTVAWQRAR